MKRFVLILISAVMAFSLVSCGGNEIEPFNEAVGYNFDVPEGWDIIRNDGVVELQHDCDESAQTADYATITALTFTLSDEQADITAKAYWEEYKSKVEALGEYKELDGAKNIEIDGTPAIKVKYSYKPTERVYVCEQIICCRYGEVFFISLTAPEKYHDDVTSDFKTAMDSFKFKIQG